MLSKLGYYADRVLELGWLAAAVLAPLFFNVYSSRVFEPDKISVIRSVALIMTVAWLVKLFEGGYRALRQSGAPAGSRQGVSAAMQGAAESGLPSWLGFLRVPMVVPILTYALVYLFTSIFTVTPVATWLGSYQRLQGTFSQFSYMFIGLIVIANMRTRKQLERLISFMILTSVPVALYGLLQANRLDPLPWAGDTATRVASSMGNAIFVAAWLIMVVPFTLYRFTLGVGKLSSGRPDTPTGNSRATSTSTSTPGSRYTSTSASTTGSRSTSTSASTTGSRSTSTSTAGSGSRARPQSSRPVPDYGWAVVSIAAALLLIAHFYFMLTLKLVSGLPFPEAQMWFMVPTGLALFYGACWAIEWLGDHRHEPMLASVLLPIAGALVLVTAFLAFVPTWSLSNELRVSVDYHGEGFLWVLFFTVVAWGGITGVAYFLGGPGAGAVAADPDRGIITSALTVSYGFLLVIQLTCIYLTQSRGPWLGIGIGLALFAVALWLVGRRRGIRWMTRIGGAVSALVLIGVVFVAVLNIPNSPLRVLDNAPVIGRGIERLGTIFRTEDGTGKVRTLIWQGASHLIASDPVRTVIGWGPEAMYVVYNRYYPAELAHWELRNATPDRSHNVEFDHMVTMGIFGLLAYYFILGAFFFYGVKILKRANNTRDQLLAITLMSAMAAHVVEIQTGIQIASTWTYFYLIIGMMVAFGYFITGYLRDEAPGMARQVTAGGYATDGAAELPGEVPAGAAVASAARTGKQAATAPGAARTAQASLAAGGNGRPAATATTGVKSKTQNQGSRPPASPGQKTSNYGSGGSGGRRPDGPRQPNQTPDPRRRQAQSQAQLRVSRAAPTGEWLKNPLMLPVYLIVLGAAVFLILTVNVANVQADTLYKQGQAYDGAQRWGDSIARYRRALDLQPFQDYYYLFLGRAYLEWSKVTRQEMQGKVNPNTGKAYTEQDIITERNARLDAAQKQLLRARDLNPRNTDHYANLGRLYLYWSDTSSEGAGDTSKTDDAVQNLEKATENSPGNAQLWDELAVAYSRDNQFDKAVQALEHSQKEVDGTYERTPFIRGQLLEERADNVRNALVGRQPLPTGGETDFGKLVLQAGQAFSDSIALNPAYFVDNGLQARVDWLLEASRPFTNSNSTVSQAELSEVLTTTVIQGYKNKLDKAEARVSEFLTQTGVLTPTQGVKAPNSLLQDLWKSPSWAGMRPGGQFKEWLDPDFEQRARDAVIPYAALGYIYFRLGDRPQALEHYGRGVDLDPSNYFNQKNYGSLLADAGRTDEGLAHLTTARDILSTYPDLSTDKDKADNYNQISEEISRVQGLKNP